MRILAALLGLLVGAFLGGGGGLLLGLGYTASAGTSCFEGQCGFVVVLWMLGGLVVGAAAGPLVALRMTRRG